MVVKAGPMAVYPDMTLYLDAGNSKSYPGTGNTWTDLTGNANATKSGGVSYNSGNNGYMSFDGSGYYATDTSKVTVNKNAYTKMAFIYPTTFSASNNIISGGSDFHAFWLAGGNLLKIGHNGAWDSASTTTQMSINNWYFVAGTFNTTNGIQSVRGSTIFAAAATHQQGVSCRSVDLTFNIGLRHSRETRHSAPL